MPAEETVAPDTRPDGRGFFIKYDKYSEMFTIKDEKKFSLKLRPHRPYDLEIKLVKGEQQQVISTIFCRTDES
jgi:diadenosine tetraphosphatase ApaH/serine/threonine PP2A family protein phosphatase